MRTSRAVAVSALLAVAAVNLLAACTPEDDSDIFETPEPGEPTPTPPEVHCQIVWTSQNAETPSQIDAFVLDAPQSAWIAGVNTFGGFTAFYQPALDVTGNSIQATLDTKGAIALSSSNSFALTLTFNGTSDGADVSVASLTTANLFVIGTDGSATEDTFGIAESFDFDGIWSSPDAEAPVELGSGQVDLLLGTGTSTTAVTLGDFGSFAICYDVNGVAFQVHPVNAANKNLLRRSR